MKMFLSQNYFLLLQRNNKADKIITYIIGITILPLDFCQRLLAKFCQPNGKVLPSYWQATAKPMANPCQAVGKNLPVHWQNKH